MAKPKLALIPAAQGTKFYSVLPSDGVGDFTFARGSVATRINAQGLIENVASGQSRLDYPMIDGVQKGCPHHILEPARTNLVKYSESFSQSYWAKTRASITSNSTISPDGSSNASKLIEDTANGSHFLLVQPVYTTSSVNNVVSLSLFAKKSERDLQIQSFASGGGENPKLNFDLTNGTATSVGTGATPTFSIQSFGNDWFRCSLTYTVSQSNSGVRFYISMVNNNSSSYQGDGSSGFYIWGAQLEIGSFPTSYIPTSGQSSGVTRSAETANGAGNASTFNDSEGVLFAEFNTLSINPASSRYIGISNGSADNRIAIRQPSGADNQVSFFAVVGGSVQVNLTHTLNILNFNKIAVKYKVNDFALWVNGVEVLTDTSGSVPAEGTFNKLDFANFNGSSLPFEGNTKQVQYFDSAIADTQLEQLTSWTSFTDMANGQLYTIE